MVLNHEVLLETLNAVDGPERGRVQQEAEQQMKNWEAEPGYHYLLQDIYLNRDLPLRVRWMAVICFKNGVERYWRATRVNAIGAEEKSRIRARLFDMVDDKNSQLIVQVAHAIARVVRFDFPAEWPDLFDKLSISLESYVFVESSLVSTNNMLTILNQIVKSVSMVRIGRARHAFQSKAPLLMPLLIKSYVKFFHIWTTSPDLTIMEICYKCLKNIRRIIPEGFEQPHKNQDIVEFFKLSISHLQALVMEHEKYSSDLLEKYVKSYSKLYVNLINNNPTSFILMPSSQEIVSTFMSLLKNKAEDIYKSTEEGDFWEALALKGILILKKMVTYIYKQGAVSLKQRGDKEEVNRAISLLKTQLFTPIVIQELCDLIINWYLRLKPSDLESWLLEPEEWTNEELSSSWEYQVRPCAENFYQDLMKFFKDDLADFILNRISTGLSQNDSIENILEKDASLCAFQLSTDSIADRVNFDKLLVETLIPEGLRNDRVENKIIKRRICLIVKTWISVNCSRDMRVRVCQLLLDFMQQDNKINDKVVQITAVQAWKAVIDDWDFNKRDVQSLLKSLVSSMLAMLQEMEFPETKLFILDTLASSLDRCNPLIDADTLASILQIVPGYWDNSSQEGNGESILKTSLLRVLKNLVIATNQNSAGTHFITIPLIQSCCTQTSEFYTLLSEDGFDLWLAVLQYYPPGVNVSDKLLEFVSLIQPALVDSTEILTTILSIARSYALLCPQVFDSDYGTEIFRVLSGYIPSMRDDSFETFITLMDILFLQQSTNESFMSRVIVSGLMNGMTNYVLDENHSIVLANKILMVLSRLPLESPEMLYQIFEHLGIDISKFMEIWMSYYKNNGNPRNKKVNLLALLSLIAHAAPADQFGLARYLSEVSRRCFLYLEEINEEANGNSKAYEEDYVYADINDYAYLDPEIPPHGEKLRYKALLDSKDAVYRVNLKQFVRQKIEVLRSQMNGEAFSALMSCNDQYTNEKLQEVLS